MNAEDISRMARLLGAKKVRVGSVSVMMNCPFARWIHSDGYDRRPSFSVFIGKRSTYNCFACGMKGNLTYLPTALWKVTGVWNERLSRFISEYDYSPNVIVKSNSVKLRPDDKLFAIFSKLDKLRPSSKYSEEDIEKWNLKFDAKEEAIVFPIFDSYGNLVALKGRKKDSKKFFFYGNNSSVKRAGLWFGQHFKTKHKKIVLCEGERDAIYLSRFGIDVWASMGLPVTREQISTIRRSNNEFILFFDNDKAGIEATNKLIKELKVFVKLYKVTDYHGCKDPAEAVEKGRLKICLESIKNA